MTKKKNYLDTNNIPKNRRDFQDFDYIDELDEESKAWLEQFAKEYYGAGFDINPTYLKREDAISTLQYLIGSDAESDKNKEKYKKHLDYLVDSKDTIVQVYKNKEAFKNIDLRKLRKVDKYYKQASGKFTKNKKHKYSKDLIHKNEELRKKCNTSTKDQQKDMFTWFFNNDKYYAAEKMIEYNNEDITTLDPETLVQFFEDYEE